MSICQYSFRLYSFAANIALSFRARGKCLILVSPPLPDPLKSTVLGPEYQNVDISQKHTIYYTLAMFKGCHWHQHIDILAPEMYNISS